MSQSIVTSLLPILMILAAASDVTSYRIPNWLTGLTAALFFPMALYTGMPLNDFCFHLLSGLILFVTGYMLFTLGMFGGGDAKLMAAAGLWLGTQQTGPFLILTAIAGGLLTLAVFGWAAFSLWAEIRELRFRAKIAAIKPKIPYGFALAVGAIMAFPGSWWLPSVA